MILLILAAAIATLFITYLIGTRLADRQIRRAARDKAELLDVILAFR